MKGVVIRWHEGYGFIKCTEKGVNFGKKYFFAGAELPYPVRRIMTEDLEVTFRGLMGPKGLRAFDVELTPQIRPWASAPGGEVQKNVGGAS